MKEYLGITGYTRKEEILHANKVYSELGLPSESLTGMYGFLTHDIQAANPEMYLPKFPSLQSLKGLLREVAPGMIPAIHLCSETNDLLVDAAERIFSFDNIYDLCKTIQINIDWPDPRKIDSLKLHFPEMYVVLQLNPVNAGRPEKKIKEYSGLVDKVLIDPSLGTGSDIPVSMAVDMIQKLKASVPEMSYVVAGGFSGENVYSKVTEIRKQTRILFSVDVEGKVRTENGWGLHPEYVEEYLLEGVRGLK